MAYLEFIANKVTAVPGSYGANEVYIVTHASNENFIEIYVTNSDGTKIRRVPNSSDIESMITSAISNSSSLVVVDNIAARDAINPPKGRVYVVDASADSTVTSGGAEYLYNDGSWVKISETESMDLVLNWSKIEDKPDFPPVADLKSAVSNSHTHSNMSQLNKIGEDSSGRLTYNNNVVSTGWKTVDW